jgi:hypothetical protein
MAELLRDGAGQRQPQSGQANDHIRGCAHPFADGGCQLRQFLPRRAVLGMDRPVETLWVRQRMLLGWNAA